MNKGDHTRKHQYKGGSKTIQIPCNTCGKQIIINLALYKYRTKNNLSKFHCSKKCVKNNGKFCSISSEKIRLIQKGLKEGKKGYQIAKENNLNGATVYNYIRKWSCSSNDRASAL